MEDSMAYKWVVILFFGIVGLMFAGSIVYLAAGNVAPDTYWGRSTALPKSTTDPTATPVDRYVLRLDQGQPIGNRIFFYRGRQDDHLRFDVIIPELDPQYPYAFKIDLATAENGFDVAGIWFHLVTLRRSFIGLQTKG